MSYGQNKISRNENTTSCTAVFLAVYEGKSTYGTMKKIAEFLLFNAE
jgi:hypothetical protein